MASYYQILTNIDPIFTAFEIWAKFCQKITKSPPPPKKNYGEIGLKFGAHWLIY